MASPCGEPSLEKIWIRGERMPGVNVIILSLTYITALWKVKNICRRLSLTQILWSVLINIAWLLMVHWLVLTIQPDVSPSRFHCLFIAGKPAVPSQVSLQGDLLLLHQRWKAPVHCTESTHATVHHRL